MKISANALLSFVLEVVALGVYVWAPFAFLDAPVWMEILLASGAVAILVLLWGRFAAPKSATRLRGVALLLFKIAVFVPALWLVSMGRAWLFPATGLALILVNVIGEYAQSLKTDDLPRH